MNFLNEWIPENLLYALGWTLVHSIWQLIAIAVGLWLALKFIAGNSADVKYKVSLGALSLSLILAVFTFIYEYAQYIPSSSYALDRMDVIFLDAPTGEKSTGFAGMVMWLVQWIEVQLPMLVNFWFLGAVMFLFRLFNSLAEIRTLRKASTPVTDPGLQKSLNELAEKLGLSKIPSLRVAEFGQSPITFGFIKPVILIPAALVLQLAPSHLEAIIAHELAHVKRQDYLVNLMQSALEVLFFYHPAFWWMSQTVKELRENVADDLAVSAGISPKELAYGLAEVLNFATQNPPELAMAAGKRRNPTLQRIKRILGFPEQHYSQNPIISIPMLLTLLLSAGLMASAQQDSPANSAAILPEINLENPELYIEESKIKSTLDHRILAVFDTTKSENNQEEIFVVSRSDEDEGAKVFRYEVKNGGYHYRISGDTIITDGDTVLLKGDTKVFLHNAPMFNMKDMPKLEMGEFPNFPQGMVELAPLPEGFLSDLPSMVMAPMPHLEPFMFEFDGESPGVFFFSDTTKMTKEERENWIKDREKRAEEWAKIVEERAASWEFNQEEFKSKMEAWEQEMAPKIKAWEEKIAAWQKEQEPKMKEFERKMKEWEKSQQPKIEEFQRKMEEWQKENEVKMQEFQKKLEAEIQRQKVEREKDN